MILPGFPKPMITASGATPFDISGSWETGDDGWDLTYVGTATRNNNPAVARTGNYSIYSNHATLGSIRYTLPASMCAGLKIIASVWHRAGSAVSTPREIKIVRPSLPDVTDVVTSSSTVYSQFSIEAVNEGNTDVYVILSSRFGTSPDINFGLFDDWRIQGVKP